MLKELTPSFFVAKLKFPVTFSYSALEVNLRIYFTEIKLLVTIHILTLYNLTSVYIFSIMFSIHFLRC